MDFSFSFRKMTFLGFGERERVTRQRDGEMTEAKRRARSSRGLAQKNQTHLIWFLPGLRASCLI